MNVSPPPQTERGRLRFFTVSEVRLDTDATGRAVVDNQKHRFAVDESGAVRRARNGEVTEFLRQDFDGLLSSTARSGESHSAEDLRRYPNDTLSPGRIHRK